MGSVHIRLGNIFDNSSDLVLLPCSAKGTISKAAREHVTRFSLPEPTPMKLGDVHVEAFTGPGTITRYIAWCASVLNDSSGRDVIEKIAQKAGEFTRSHPEVRLV